MFTQAQAECREFSTAFPRKAVRKLLTEREPRLVARRYVFWFPLNPPQRHTIRPHSGHLFNSCAPFDAQGRQKWYHAVRTRFPGTRSPAPAHRKHIRRFRASPGTPPGWRPDNLAPLEAPILANWLFPARLSSAGAGCRPLAWPLSCAAALSSIDVRRPPC